MSLCWANKFAGGRAEATHSRGNTCARQESYPDSTSLSSPTAMTLSGNSPTRWFLICALATAGLSVALLIVAAVTS